MRCQADGVVLFRFFGKKNRLMKLLNKIFEILSGSVFPVLISCAVSIVPIQIKGIQIIRGQISKNQPVSLQKRCYESHSFL